MSTPKTDFIMFPGFKICVCVCVLRFVVSAINAAKDANFSFTQFSSFLSIGVASKPRRIMAGVQLGPG